MPDRVLSARLWALGLVLLSFPPWANWIAGGHAMPGYSVYATSWLSGAAISLGLAVVLMLLVRRSGWWPAGWTAVAEAASDRANLTAAIIGVLALVLFSVIALTVLSGRPVQIDEVVQLMQARIFSEGRLSRPADPYPEFFSALNVVDVNGSVYGQFPPGGPLMLLPGVIFGVPWLTGPVFGAIAVVAFWKVVRATETPGVALGAALLLMLAPFMAFMAGSQMNHVTTFAWLCLALLGLRVLTSSDAHRPWVALFTGFSFGVMLAIRPLDGAVFAFPAGVWLLMRTIQGRTSLASLVASGLGIAIPVLGIVAFNVATTGEPLLFAYELLWGASHGIGFHQPPWGVAHTPVRGFELVNIYFVRLQSYLFETPLPSLIPIMAALALTKRVSAFDRYLLSSSALLVFGYFAYWHDGFFLGPRFFYLLLPVLVLWTARLPQIVRERFPSLGVDRYVLLVYGVSAVVACVVSLPFRARQYTNGLLSMRHDYVAPAEAAGVTGAIILVRESWGAQLIARLWGLGVSRSDAEALYRSVDTCVLEFRISELEARGVRDQAATDRLRPLTADSERLVESALSPDKTQRMLPGLSYPPQCYRRAREDAGGYAFMAPLLARDPGSNLYARELHARDTLLLPRYASRAVYLLRAASSGIGAPLLLERVSMDSARAEWAASAAGR